MTYGIDLAGEEIRWVRLKEGQPACGRVELGGEGLVHARASQTLRELFTRERVRRFVFPIWGQGVRVKLFPSDKVDISELEDNVAWEARFLLGYDSRREVLSFDPMRTVGTETWIVAAAAPLEEVRSQIELFPFPPSCVETSLTALANAVLESRWGKTDVMILHLDKTRAFLAVISHGNPILMQEIPNFNLRSVALDSDSLAFWHDELKLRRNFLPQDNRKLDNFLLSGEAAVEPRNAVLLGERVGLPGEVFNPFEGLDEAPLFTLAYACALREAS